MVVACLSMWCCGWLSASLEDEPSLCHVKPSREKPSQSEPTIIILKSVFRPEWQKIDWHFLNRCRRVHKKDARH
jgi:hypothetical protein